MKFIFPFLLTAAAAFGQARFVTGQAARAVIGQPNFTAQNTADTTQVPPINPSARILGAVGGVAYANNSLFVVDSNRVQATPNQNRVLIYDNISGLSGQIPPADAQLITSGVRCPVCQGIASTVIGQTDFTGVNPGITAGTYNTPNDVATDGKVLVVSDTNNNRVLIYKTIPTNNGANADVVLGQKDFTSFGSVNQLNAASLRGPEGVWIQNGKLFVADTGNDRIMIWNTIPTSNNKDADVVIGQPNFTTASPLRNAPINAQTMDSPTGVSADDSHIFVTDLGNNRVLIWNTLSPANGQAADVEIGQPDFTTGDANHVANICPSTGSGTSIVYPYECAATLNYPRFSLSDGTRLFVSDSGNDRIIIFNTIPTKSGARGNVVLGQYDEFSNLIANGSNTAGFTTVQNQGSPNSMITPEALAWDGTNLYVADPYNRRILLFSPGDPLVADTGVTNAASREVFAIGSIAFSSTSTITAGDVITITIDTPTYAYTVLKTDTLASVISSLVTKINGTATTAGDPNVLAFDNALGDQIILVAKISGVKGNSITYSITTASATSGGTSTITATAAGANLAGGQDASQVAPGTLISVFADGGLTDQAPASAPQGFAMPRQLAGAELYVDGQRAPLLYVSPKQINAQMPYEVGDAQGVTTWVRTVRQDGTVVTTSPVASPIVAANPGIFATGTTEPRAAIAVHGSSYGVGVVSVDGSVNVGDVGTITINGHAYAYTVVTGDTLTSIEFAFIKLINANTSEVVTASAAGSFTRIVLTAKKAGTAGNGITLAETVSSGAKLLLTVLGNGASTCCANTAGALITNSNPAIPDEFISIYATGLGIVQDAGGRIQGITGEPYSGPLSNPSQSVDALINGSSTANVINAGLLPGSVGIYLVQLQLGDNLTTNLASELRIAQGVNTSNIVTIPVKVP
jgi:uncharacterized protein (TIGR03437 family)